MSLAGGGGGEELGEVMARLAALARRTARYLSLVSGAYAFFAYALAVTGAVLVAIGFSVLLPGQPVGAAAGAGAAVGIALGTATQHLVLRRVTRFLESVGGERTGRGIVYATIFIVPALAANLAVVAYGRWELLSIAWYYGLTASLLIASLYAKGQGAGFWAPFLTAATVMLVGIVPLTLLAEAAGPGASAMIALGFMTLAYFAGGSHSLYLANRVFEE